MWRALLQEPIRAFIAFVAFLTFIKTSEGFKTVSKGFPRFERMQADASFIENADQDRLFNFFK